eukprot:1690926-Rhodomonas_salina.2
MRRQSDAFPFLVSRYAYLSPGHRIAGAYADTSSRLSQYRASRSRRVGRYTWNWLCPRSASSTSPQTWFRHPVCQSRHRIASEQHAILAKDKRLRARHNQVALKLVFPEKVVDVHGNAAKPQSMSVPSSTSNLGCLSIVAMQLGTLRRPSISPQHAVNLPQ